MLKDNAKLATIKRNGKQTLFGENGNKHFLKKERKLDLLENQSTKIQYGLNKMPSYTTYYRANVKKFGTTKTELIP